MSTYLRLYLSYCVVCLALLKITLVDTDVCIYCYDVNLCLCTIICAHVYIYSDSAI